MRGCGYAAPHALPAVAPLALLNAVTAALLALFIVALAPLRRAGTGALVALVVVLEALVVRNVLYETGVLVPTTELHLLSLGAYAALPPLVWLAARRLLAPERDASALATGAAVLPFATILAAGTLVALRGDGVTLDLWQGYAILLQLLAAVCAVGTWRVWRASERPRWVGLVLGAFALHWLFSAGSWATAVFVDAPAWGAAFEAGSLVGLLAFAGLTVVLSLRHLPALAPPAPTLAPYAGTGLGDADRARLATRLRDLMRTDAPHLDPTLSAGDLAERLGTSPRELSEVLNVEIGESFFEFVNRHRVEEATRRLGDPAERDATILEVLYASGFNSKSAFHRAFRERVGQTPSAYRQAALGREGRSRQAA